jgi:flagellar biosynthesis protein FlhB
MYKSISTLFLTSILLFFLGYNFAFNTEKTIAKYLYLQSLEKDSKLYKIISSQWNKFWVKICGFVMMLYALMLIVAIIASILREI